VPAACGHHGEVAHAALGSIVRLGDRAQCARVEPDARLAAHHRDGRRQRAAVPYRVLGLASHLEVPRPRQPMRHDRALERDHRPAARHGLCDGWVDIHRRPAYAGYVRRRGLAVWLACLALAGSSAVPASAALPSGRTNYRHLADYTAELHALSAANPDLVRPITLPHSSRLGRPVEGIEITTSPTARDGKPVYLQLGMHHAREWPSAELTLEFAYDLIAGYRAGDPRARALVDQVRTIVVPVVNPDGFDFSREAASGSQAEQHRKNCPSTGCAVNAGVDLNRNYGHQWGGPGSSTDPTLENFRGPSPFSEPESQNVRELIASRQAVVMITNHTFGDEILHQPGINTDPLTPDESSFNSLGAAMAAENGYQNVYSWHNGGNHVGTTDGWSYYTTGGLGYVFEIGPTTFHPAFTDVIAEYDGSAVPGGGNREAYYIAMQAAANPALHSVLNGSAPPGAILRLSKSFETQTWTGTIPERLESTMEVPASGRFEWHVNQAARPLVPNESWTLTCERPEGTVQQTEQVKVARGESRELDLSACGPPPDTRPRPSVAVKLVAGFDGRRYRVRVSGRLRGVADLWRCDGAVRIGIKVRSKQLGARAAGLDERCAFSRRFTFGKRALPRGLRRRGARLRLRASATWQGSEFLAPASGSAAARVRRRR
jgi:carboxypeptidase T